MRTSIAHAALFALLCAGCEPQQASVVCSQDSQCLEGEVCKEGRCRTPEAGCAGKTKETACTDGLDDDCDGKVDCADPDCPGEGCSDPCSNGVLDGQETDVDCGGSCGGCADGDGCSVDGDCVSGYCESGSCAKRPTCSDNLLNGTEVDVDCGGTCPRCPEGKACGDNADCATNLCGEIGVCETQATCSDAQKNAEETDVDCGGGTCRGCPLGLGCLVDGDCDSGFCDQAACSTRISCTDDSRNGAETDVDCGGGTCPTCALGKACAAGSDCETGNCEGGLCLAPATCTDGRKNGAESDVDCGGGTCPKCGLGKACSGGSNCASWSCVSGTCTNPVSCKEILIQVPAAPDGFYTIDPDGAAGEASFRTYCRMKEAGGGWTLVQRTVWSWTENVKLSTGWSAFHGTTLGAPDSGKAFRVAGKHWPALSAGKEHLLVLVPRGSTGSSCAKMVYQATTKAPWAMSSTAKTATVEVATQPLGLFITSGLSTKDSGSTSGMACVNSHYAVPWTYTNCCQVCPSYNMFASTSGSPIVNSALATTADSTGKTLSTACAGVSGPAKHTTSSGAVYYGINTMEYLVR